jgi:hypothetical protein
MPVDFRSMLSPETVRHMEVVDAEVERIYRLTDRFLGRHLLKLARQAQQENPQYLGTPDHLTYAPTFIWEVVAEIAKRLGEAPNRNEARDRRVQTATPRQLRELAGTFLKNSDLAYGLEHRGWDKENPEKVFAIKLFMREPVHGNPVAFALDRICEPAPAHDDRRDYIARSIREAGRYVDGVQVDRWSPEAVTKAENDADFEPLSVTELTSRP